MEHGFANRNIYILGCSDVAEALIRDTAALVRFAGVLDISGQDAWEDFCGLPVLPYHTAKKQLDGLIVDCTGPYYEPSFTEDMLIFDGFAPYSDYIDYVCFRALVLPRKVMVISGFCHADDIFRGLVLLPCMLEKYQIYSFSYDVKHMTKYSSRILNRLIRLCSVYIYNQNANDRLNFCGDELPADCVKICIPLVRFYGIWPQINHNHNSYENPYYVMPAGCYDGAFIGGDLEINRRIDMGLDWQEIYRQISSPTFYPADKLSRILEQSFRQMEYSERGGDLKIVSYIRENYREKRLFKDYRHIDNPIVFEYIRQIGIILGEHISFGYMSQYITNDLHTYTEMPVYPAVAAALGLIWAGNQAKYCVRSYEGTKYVTFEEYVRWYTAYSCAVRDMKENW